MASRRYEINEEINDGSCTVSNFMFSPFLVHPTDCAATIALLAIV
uniref:Transmembrane protein n=1 Tax=Heterorhabditis bacteriophora TaxID=37862 RepID=A0A1I7W8P9_HETBA